MAQSRNQLQTILTRIGELQQQRHTLAQKNYLIEHQLSNKAIKKSELIHTNHSLKQQLSSIYRSLLTMTSNKCNALNSLQSRIRALIQSAEQQLQIEKPLPAPAYNFQYRIQKPAQVATLSERVAGIRENLEKMKAKKEEQVRNLKIRISLAEIELKELKNRNKKL